MATPTNLPASFVSGAILTADQMNNLRGAFRVLQVVTGTATTEVANSTTTLANTGLSATITPQASTNKILVIVNQNSCFKSAGNSANAIGLVLYRDATAISNFAYYGLYTDSALQNRGSFATTVLDSPASTSAITYKTMFRNDGGNNASVGVCVGNVAVATITLMEISA